MIAFWAVALLLGYGCFRGGGLASVVGRWLSNDTLLIDNFPLVHQLKVSTLIAAGVLAALLFGCSRILNGPRLADLLIDTEAEMRKVTWPGWGEVVQGTMAVTSMVIVLFLFLTGVDALFVRVILMLIPGTGGNG
jgi:preprotein translocase SecE subunit